MKCYPYTVEWDLYSLNNPPLASATFRAVGSRGEVAVFYRAKTSEAYIVLPEEFRKQFPGKEINCSEFREELMSFKKGERQGESLHVFTREYGPVVFSRLEQVEKKFKLRFETEDRVAICFRRASRKPSQTENFPNTVGVDTESCELA